MTDKTISREVEMTPETYRNTFNAVYKELRRVVVGQETPLAQILYALFSGGHVLLTGMPGLGRTLIVQSLAEILGLECRRLQFTPDLLPTDIVGTEILEEDRATGQRSFRFFKGPVFANLVLADEVNRSPTRTQSALLEVMQERQVTVGGQTYFMPKPNLIIATQNTLDTEGVWALGEAQVDRFMMSIELSYPTEGEEQRMLGMTTGTAKVKPGQVATPEIVLAMQKLTREVPVPPSVKAFALAVVRASRPDEPDSLPRAKQLLRLGASPRAAQAALLGAKVSALSEGRTHVSIQDVLRVIGPVLAHRLLLDFKAQADGVTFRQVLQALVEEAQKKMSPQLSGWTLGLIRQKTWEVV